MQRKSKVVIPVDRDPKVLEETNKEVGFIKTYYATTTGNVEFKETLDPAIIEAMQPKPLFTCEECNKTLLPGTNSCKCPRPKIEYDYCDYCGCDGSCQE